MTLPALYAFVNTHVLSGGQALPQDIYFSPDTGLITPNYTRSRPDATVTKIDLKGEYVVAPGYLELQINGGWGVHFTMLGKGAGDEDAKLQLVARELVKKGVTGWWATVPTVEEGRWKEILQHLRPRSFDQAATLLGAHVEGPFLQPTKKGAHNASFFQTPPVKMPAQVYGPDSLHGIIQLITIAPELPEAIKMIRILRMMHPQIKISLGHTSADYAQGLEALKAGATGLTHVFNAMNPLHHRDPGIIGLISNNPSSDTPVTAISTPDQHLLSSTTSVSDWLARQMSSLDPSSDTKTLDRTPKKPECFFSIIPDTIHLHPSILSLAHRAAPHKCMLITDSIELAGMPDGIYPANDQITSRQVKVGNRVTIEDTDTLVGSCITLDECVRNMVKHAGCTLAESVRCVTENVAAFIGDSCRGRGKTDVGYRADFAILDREGTIRQTWIGGVKVWDIEQDPSLKKG